MACSPLPRPRLVYVVYAGPLPPGRTTERVPLLLLNVFFFTATSEDEQYTYDGLCGGCDDGEVSTGGGVTG